ncbi:MAG: methionyl-tRNA formyltransferase [Gammaproteobacteria bacterium]|nr:methionyl-tRNA formyltransferase [Gammaproteobacteria bacterium]
MPAEVVLLTAVKQGPEFAEELRTYASDLVVRLVASRAELDAVFAVPVPRRRLIAFTTDLIVPAAYLEACDCGAYNFHPGSPAYPGVYPESFAVWDGATRFGATAHAMTAQVDAGPIVATEWFPISPAWGRMHVATLAYEALMRVFLRLAPWLATEDAPLPPCGESWSGPTRLRAEYRRFCEIPADITLADYQRRYRAFGEGMTKDFHLMLHGHRYVIEQPWSEAQLAQEMGREN